MLKTTRIKTIPVGCGKLIFHLLPSGDIHKINYERKMINQLRSTNYDRQVQNIYMRVTDKFGTRHAPLLGSSSVGDTHYSGNRVFYSGKVFDQEYSVVLHVLEQTWFYDVSIKNTTADQVQIELFYIQDIGIKDEGAIRNNEAYNSQYIDHRVYDTETGYVITSLQNQGNKEYLQVGSLTRTSHYGTDGFQFFGLESKLTDVPEVLKNGHLPDQVYQYEFACAQLESEALKLSASASCSSVFYGHFVANHPEILTDLEYRDKIKEMYQSLDRAIPEQLTKLNLVPKLDTRKVFASQELSIQKLDELYPNRIQEEFADGSLLSFFCKESEHVVLAAKESLVERSHGHIILSGNTEPLSESVFASTNYIYGLFASQTVIGNTSFNRLSSNQRNSLNLMKAPGMRIFIEIDGAYRLLTMPAVYEMGLNHSRWLYQIADDMFEVIVYTAFSGATLRLKFSSMKDRKYNVVFVTQLVMGNEELAHDYICEIEDNRARLRLADSTFAYSHYPDLNYKIEVSATKFEFLDEKWLFGSDGYEEGLFLIRVTDASGSLTISGSIENDAQSTIEDYDTEKQRFKKKYQELLNGFELSLKSASASVRSELEKLNLIAYWYAHDALIHYASPHGLEQFGGAAWGTRDVLQGPFEFFMATHKFSQAKDVLLNVFRHQFLETGNWPQWFMFDRYSKIQTHEAHGDIIVWPMRALANYLLATGDYDLLDNKVCYTQNTNFEYTMSQHSIYEHLRLEIKHILDNLIPGTHLSVYGDGDWDDTLQPANAELRQSMTSGWTTALTFEAFFLLGEALREYDPDYSRFSLDKASKIKEDYEKYVIQDGIPAGFLDFSAGYPRPMIHPNDNVTKIKYRLLPLQRGIISELFEPSQAALAFKTIMDNLDHPDGVRLMNTTVPYQGGKNTYFKRAETAANFGREIGLQYVHAHIRFLEACWRIGEKERAWRGLFQINPINIQEAVANADYRQANTYFSSSDANFMNRYQAMAEFAKIHEGKIKVKGGWRIYSSGPGIYLNILLGRILGISASAGSLLIDPQLPEMLDGLELKYNLFGKKARLIYRIASQSAKKKQIRVNGKLIDCELTANKYRLGGCHIPLSDLNLHQETENLIEILCF